MSKKSPTHCDDLQQLFLDAGLGILLLCGFLHVTEVSVSRNEISFTVELETLEEEEEEDEEEEEEEKLATRRTRRPPTSWAGG